MAQNKGKSQYLPFKTILAQSCNPQRQRCASHKDDFEIAGTPLWLYGFVRESKNNRGGS
ncbi:MAG: hypothetical protein M0036_25705 [Desulfobacteraceae bacterium]|nr:hypothetical protein [Desulfobacteraceae bacterium]